MSNQAGALAVGATAFHKSSTFDLELVESIVGRSIAEIERALILQTLHCLCGNRTRAAHVLGISIRCLRNKIREYKQQGTVVPTASNAANRKNYV